jgi:hypothetical protein
MQVSFPYQLKKTIVCNFLKGKNGFYLFGFMAVSDIINFVENLHIFAFGLN